MAATGEDVYCTLMLSDSYLPGAIVLAHSLRDGGTKKKLACMVTLDTLSTETVTRLKELYDYILPVPRIANTKPANLYLMNRGDLLYAFTKIHLWRLDQFRKIVYIDSDVVALTAPDELFDIDAPFAAAPDIGWPDAFNSGVMVLTPDRETFGEIKELADSSASFDGADQGLLNQYYEPRGWHRLSFTYNTTPNAQYQWEPAYRHYKDSIKMVHFIGRPKPWTLAPPQGGSETYNELLGHWWTVWNRHNQTADVDADPHHRAAADCGPPMIQISQMSSSRSLVPLMHQSSPKLITSQVLLKPIPILKTKPFVAPAVQWDATRAPPPQNAPPEAANFPNQEYAFSSSNQLFSAPASYPAPPKDMWYEVPSPPVTAPPAPIFPWERKSRPPPSRVFADADNAPEAVYIPPPVLPRDADEVDYSFAPPEDAPQAQIVHQAAVYQTQEAFSPQANAWDNMTGIERYVRAVMDTTGAGGRRNSSKPTSIDLSGVRRGSLILTAFPSADERPSLPVTPAPRRRGTFWGPGGGSGGDGEVGDEREPLKQAEGVPDQIDWVCPRCGFSS
ncbi:nucleotide-diphospho-sugar transferase, partial [Trichodelitschia bisporula]